MGVHVQLHVYVFAPVMAGDMNILALVWLSNDTEFCFHHSLKIICHILTFIYIYVLFI